NYYGLRRENEQAIRFFQRALRLNPGVASIWVLVGHEFMELKNNAAALHVVQKSDRGRPARTIGAGTVLDRCMILSKCQHTRCFITSRLICANSRMLVALGDVYQKMGRLRNAEKCFISAFKYGDVEGTALWMLAKLYESENQMQRAARSYEEYLREYQDIEDTDENVVYCVQFLAKHYLEQRDISEEGRLVLRTAEAMKEQHDHDNAGDMNPIKPIDDSFNSTGGFDITQGT
ncbi:hypothetical protein OSTOST_17964, partial [Ostertagia ostertagi]